MHQNTKFEQPIPDLFPSSNKELVNILTQMLEINPHFRPSARDLLKNKLFDSIRLKSVEISSKVRIKIKIDCNEDAPN